MLSIQALSTFQEDQEVDLNEKAYLALGGLQGVSSGVKADISKGLVTNAQDLELRRKTYGRNEFPEPPAATWFDLFLESFQDTTIIVLVVAAVVSFVVGMYEDPSKGWIEGAAILSAVIIVAVVTATNNYNKELQFRKLNAVKNDVSVGVIRDGQSTTINVKELVVGDIVILNAGDRVPGDGVLVSGSDVTINESALTGESDDKKKSNLAVKDGGDPFLLSGTDLSTGYAHMLVTAVGEQSKWGKTKAKLAAETSDTPLQEKLDVLAGQIGNLGMVSAVLTFFAMLAIWYLHPEGRDPEVNFYEFLLKAFIMGVTIVVVAVPEGLPLAVTLSLAFSTQKMMKDNNLIRVLAACETMGNATNICSDKTGTLTQNKMTVVQGWVAGSFSTNINDINIPPSLVQYISEGASVNSTANLIQANGSTVVSGNKTEGAILMLIRDKFKADYVNLRANFDSSRGDRLITFSSARKRMSVIMRNGKGKGAICYTKGASEMILALSNKFTNAKGEEQTLDAKTKDDILQAIDLMAKNALRTVAVAHRVIASYDGSEDNDSIEKDLVIDAIFGIKDPLRPDVTEAVRTCHAAGIFVRMVTGDNIETAKAIARECGILTEDGIAMEGPVFRKLTPKQLDEILPRLQVLARSSPDDKHTLVTRLNGVALPDTKEQWEAIHPDCSWEQSRDLILPGYREEWKLSRQHGFGEVVGVTGDGTNDGPALKAADVGLSMGMSGTDVAKEASDIIILDDNFSSIVKSVMWGRAVFDNIRKFLQFQLTVNVVALTITFISAMTGKEPPLNAVMMLWVNLIMDTMGALALGTEPPSNSLLSRKPYRRSASLISSKMMRNIAVQFLFQMAVLCYLLLAGAEHFGTVPESTQHLTIIFNTFVFCQIFNEINARSIGDEMNVFKDLDRNTIFIAIILFTAVAQYFIVEFGGQFVRTEGLSHEQWIKCILLGSISLPLGGLMRLIPAREGEANFAEISPLLADKVKSGKKQSSGNAGFSFSFLLWLIVVTSIPVVVFQHFGEQWSGFLPYLQNLISTLQAAAK